MNSDAAELFAHNLALPCVHAGTDTNAERLHTI